MSQVDLEDFLCSWLCDKLSLLQHPASDEEPGMGSFDITNPGHVSISKLKGLTGNKIMYFQLLYWPILSYIVGNFSNTGKSSFSIDCQTLCFNSNFFISSFTVFTHPSSANTHLAFSNNVLSDSNYIDLSFLLYLTNRPSHTIQIINHFGLFAYCLLCIHLFSQRSIISNSRIDSLLTAYTVGYWGACVALLGAIC